MNNPSYLSVGVALAGLSLAATYVLCQQKPAYRPSQIPDLVLREPQGRSPWDATVRGQVVLMFDHRQEIDGVDMDVMSVKAPQVTVLGLVPLDKQAPLPASSWVLCTLYTERIAVRFADGLERNSVDEIGFNCGGKRYLFNKLDIQ